MKSQRILLGALPVFVLAACGEIPEAESEASAFEETDVPDAPDGGVTRPDPDAGNSADTDADAPTPDRVQPFVPAVESTTGCRVHNDCAAGMFCLAGVCSAECEADADCGAGLVCTGRGQCEVPGDADSDERQPVVDLGGAVVTRSTESVTIPVSAGQQDVVLEFDVELGEGVDALLYRLVRSDGGAVSPTTELVERLSGGRHELVVPVGAASPTALDPEPVLVELMTQGGRVQWVLEPVEDLTGLWSADLRLEVLGRTGVDVTVGLEVEPDGATLDGASAVGLYWPTDDVFMGLGEVEEPWVRVNLSRDSVSGAWTGGVESVVLLDDPILPPAPLGSVGRSIRVELSQRNLEIQGRVLDRWEGLYEVRAADGALRPAVVSMEGTLTARRVAGALPAEWVDDSELQSPSRAVWGRPDLSMPCAEWWSELPCSRGSAWGPADLGLLDATERTVCVETWATDVLESSVAASELSAVFTDGGTGLGEFMDDCLSGGTGGVCATDERASCAAALLANELWEPSVLPVQRARLVGLAGDLRRSATLGPRLRVFGQAMRLRADWMSQTAWPAFVLTSIRNAAEAQITQWREQVVEPARADIASAMTPSVLAMMGQELAGSNVSDQRARYAVEVSQSWTSWVDAVRTEASRWHLTLQNEESRTAQFERMRREAFRMYVTAGVLSELNRTAGVGWMNQTMRSGLAAAWDAIAGLNRSLSELVFARDGEVVVTTSVDGSRGLDGLLAARRGAAMAAVTRARTQTEEILQTMRAEALREAELASRFDSEASTLLQQLVDACGRPSACQTLDPSDLACLPEPEAGACGVSFADGDEPTGFDATSAAGRALLEVQDALLGIAESEGALDLHVSMLELKFEELQAQAAEIEEWNLLRMQGVVATGTLLSDISEVRRQAILSSAANLDQQLQIRELGIAERMQLMSAQDQQLVEQLQMSQAQFLERENLRDMLIDLALQNLGNWEQITLDGIQTDYEALLEEIIARRQDSARQTRSRRIGQVLGGIANTILGVVTKNPGAIVNGVMTVATAGMNNPDGPSSAPDIAAATRTRDAQLRQAELSLAASETQIEQMRIGQEVTALEEMAALDREQRGIVLQRIANQIVRSRDYETLALERLRAAGELEQSQYQVAIAELQADIQLQQMELQADLTYREQVAAFRARQLAFHEEVIRTTEYEFRVLRAELALEQVLARHAAVVENARFVLARLERVIEQRRHVSELLGSPAILFGRAAALERAELSLEQARGAVMDWLVALEHYAVRPFADERAVIVLTTSPDELEAVVVSLDQLALNCGGPWSRRVERVSLRDQLLGLNRAVVDPVDGRVLTPAEQLRQVLDAGRVDVDGRTRYRTESTVEGLLSTGRYLGTTFELNAQAFSNLGASCNTRARSVSLELVGDVGSGTPVVTVIHDGLSTLRSCQPDIARLTSEIGTTTTSYGPVTVTRTSPRAVSPVASVNATAPAPEWNTGLDGLPLAGRYTLLVDRTLPPNQDIAWDRLEDIIVNVEFEYQDLFPDGRCR